jgi:transposase InsO family protein
VSVSRPPVLAAGEQVRFRGQVRSVTGLAGGMALLSGAGADLAVPLAKLFADPGFAVVTAGRPAPLPPEGLLDGLPTAVTDRARWLESHLAEVVSGLPADAGPDAVPRPEYGPAATSLRQREIAKAAELRLAGHDVPLRTLQRLRRSYETDGVWGLVDHRFTRQPSVAGRVDERVVDAVRRAVAEETDRSTGTVDRLRRRTAQILAAEHGMADPSPVMPSRATFYRLVARVSSGRHTFGSARTRRSLAKRPDGPFGTVTAVRPGEWMQIDSTPVDVRVVLDNGMIDRAELTWLIDCATRTIPAAVLRPSTKAVDAALLLARALTPEPMRPGWADALRMSRSVLPHRRLTAVDQRLEHAAARPVIVPETIVCDHGMVYMSQAFRSACRALGISFQPSHKGSPWEKGAVERSLGSVATLFAQYAAGYVGSSTEQRGRDAEQEAAWSITELQDLLDEWIVAVWQNRPHDGLRHPLMPGKALTPNEQYAALAETAGYVPVALSASDYIELLPVTWRTVNAYGIKISNRKYDCADLNPYRHQDSGVTARKGLWEVHHDPYDVTRIWVRNHHESGWITVPWTQLKAAAVPFGEAAWEHARRLLARRGEDPATEQEIAQAAAALLDKAERPASGEPMPSKKDRRAAARARVTAVPAWPRPDTQPDEPEEETSGDDAGLAAKVIPLGIFDPFEEAGKPW